MKHLYFIAAALLVSAAGRSQCTTPVITATTGPASPICSGSTATLSADTDASQILWFNASTAGSQVGSGSPFQTPAITTSTQYWVEARNVALGIPIAGAAKTAPTSTGGTTVVAGTNPWGLQFTATQSFILNSVDVFLSSTTAGTITIELKDSSWGLLQTITVAAPAGGTGAAPVQFTVPINLTIQPGSYKLVVVSGSPAMIRDLGTNSFPYPLGTVGSVTGGTINNANTNSGVYYFLYNWNVTPGTICASPRQQVTVDVQNTAAPTGAASQTFAPGETLADLDVTGENLQWYANAAGTITLDNSTTLTSGSTYWVSQAVNGCAGPLLAITVSPEMGVGENELQQMAFYPNPVTSALTFSGNVQISKVEVYSVQGQKLYTRNFSASTVEADLSALASGVYIAKVYSGTAYRNIRIIKE
jgi:hypothetical protein